MRIFSKKKKGGGGRESGVKHLGRQINKQENKMVWTHFTNEERILKKVLNMKGKGKFQEGD
jgi:hypothetical protein